MAEPHAPGEPVHPSVRYEPTDVDTGGVWPFAGVLVDRDDRPARVDDDLRERRRVEAGGAHALAGDEQGRMRLGPRHRDRPLRQTVGQGDGCRSATAAADFVG